MLFVAGTPRSTIVLLLGLRWSYPYACEWLTPGATIALPLRLEMRALWQELDWERRHLGGAWKGAGRWPERREAATRDWCLAKTPRTPKTPMTEWPARSAYHSPAIGLCEALAAHRQLAVAKHASARGPPTHGCPGCPGCPGRPPSTENPCGRSAR